MNIVMDTNVFISGVFFNGPPFQILEAWQSGQFELIVSEEILEEYRRVGEVLTEQYPGVDINPILNFLIARVRVYGAVELQAPVCEDPDDDKFLACALSSNTTVIISGDKHLLKVSGYEGIEILKPREFINRYLA
jgi:putative PIN family toxin of toxin-antitoxin system